MQKYYIRDFLTKELEKNDGKLTQYYVENDHEAIIEREIRGTAGIPERKSSVRLGERYCPGKCPGALTRSTDERADRKVS